MTRMDRPAFSVGNVQYTWRSVVLAARLRGDWRHVEEEVRHGIACLRQAEESGETLSSDELGSAAASFRHRRRLTAAEEMEAWLAAWDLCVAEWMGYVRRTLLRQRHAEAAPALAADHGPIEAEMERLTWPTAVCSGALQSFARALAARAAAYSTEHAHTGVVDGGTVAMERLDEAYRRLCTSAVTESALHAIVRTHQLEWTRVDCDRLSFTNPEVAAEALLCISEDGEIDGTGIPPMTTVRATQLHLGDLQPDLRARLAGARSGDLIGPLRVGQYFELFHVLGKVLPALEDPAVRLRAEQAVVERAVTREIDDRVRWHAPS